MEGFRVGAMTARNIAVELANNVIAMNFKSQEGQRLTELAYEVLGVIDPGDKLSVFYLLTEIQENTTVPKLEDLRKSLLTMSPDELRAKIIEIRKDRIIRKEAPKAKVDRAKKKDKTTMDLRELMASMSDAERDQFLKELEA